MCTCHAIQNQYGHPMKQVLQSGIFLLLLFCFSCENGVRWGDPDLSEILIFDQTFTHDNTEEDDKKMGFSIFPYPEDLPANWERPRNFKDGNVYYRLSVISKPDDRLVYYQTGFQWEEDCDGNHLKEKFPHRDMIPITSTGIYTASQSLPSFWEPDCQDKNPIDWTTPMDRILVVLMDDNFRPIDNRWGYGSDIENIDAYFPMQVHVQVVVVPEGGEFRGWDKYEITVPVK